MNSTAGCSPQLHETARERFLVCEGKPLFVGDWLKAVFIHYEIDPAILQPHIPFSLDLHNGKAYVSLVAFTMNRLRPRIGGNWTEFLFKPIATHEFFNVRTYVRYNGESGIYFIAEWLSNWLSTQLGPFTYGLPYRFGRIKYQHQDRAGLICGTVVAGEAEFSYRGDLNCTNFEPCAEHSLSEFLLERYTAFTGRGDARRLFRIWHKPWQQKQITVQVDRSDLLGKAGPWFRDARRVGANYSVGVQDVWMGRPHHVCLE
jgi:uncharacterized protein YqjF (DUF2071 family)